MVLEEPTDLWIVMKPCLVRTRRMSAGVMEVAALIAVVRDDRPNKSVLAGRLRKGRSEPTLNGQRLLRSLRRQSKKLEEGDRPVICVAQKTQV